MIATQDFLLVPNTLLSSQINNEQVCWAFPLIQHCPIIKHRKCAENDQVPNPAFRSLLYTMKERFNQNAVRTIEAFHNRTSFAKIRKKVTEQFLRKQHISVEICHFRHKNGRRFKTNDSSHIIFGEHTHTDIYVAHAKLEKKLLNSF